MLEKLFPTVSARIAVRYVINFAMEPLELGRRLPVDWLEPQTIGGAAVMSLCFLTMRGATIGSSPRPWGTSGDHCAVRWGVVDRRTGESAVWVERRLTGSLLAHLSTRYGVPCTHPLAKISIAAPGEGSAGWAESIWDEGDLAFRAEFAGASDGSSPLFATEADFEAFLHGSPRSFSVGNDGVSLNVVDLVSKEARFSRVEAKVDDGCIGGRKLSTASIDSAFVTRDAAYTWRYVERIPLTVAGAGKGFVL